MKAAVGIALIFIGASCMDSEHLLIPLLIVAVGVWLMKEVIER